MIRTGSQGLHRMGWLAGAASAALIAGCAQTATEAPAADAPAAPAYEYPFQDPSLTPEALAAHAGGEGRPDV